MFKEDKESIQFLNDETVKQKLASAKKISEVQSKDYDAIFYVGGHGPVIDLASDPTNARLISDVRTHPSIKLLFEAFCCMLKRSIIDDNADRGDTLIPPLPDSVVLELQQDRVCCMPRPRVRLAIPTIRIGA